MKLSGMVVGDKIRLIPKTRHGKNRVREHGDSAVVVHVKPASFCTETPDKDWRWIDNNNDKNFDWEILND